MGRRGRRPKGIEITRELLAEAEQSCVWADKRSNMKTWHWVVSYKGEWLTLCYQYSEDLFWNTGELVPCATCARYTMAIQEIKAEAKTPQAASH